MSPAGAMTASPGPADACSMAWRAGSGAMKAPPTRPASAWRTCRSIGPEPNASIRTLSSTSPTAGSGSPGGHARPAPWRERSSTRQQIVLPARRTCAWVDGAIDLRTIARRGRRISTLGSAAISPVPSGVEISWGASMVHCRRRPFASCARWITVARNSCRSELASDGGSRTIRLGSGPSAVMRNRSGSASVTARTVQTTPRLIRAPSSRVTRVCSATRNGRTADCSQIDNIELMLDEWVKLPIMMNTSAHAQYVQ
jgi:hypothetical protein